ncbi:MAG TPA: carboxypeptidase regulatory-like domain-containing protein [Lacipirellulaceae bacterium]|jgi:hypothetical protein|nr:carboxypeptidase regulatory-like domain-containing protein [Lacipirellulaceae bacterium]
MLRVRDRTVIEFLLLVSIVGCGKTGPALAPVHGRVTLDGEPVGWATVMFQPDASGSPSYGNTDQDGRYVLGYKRGQQGAAIGSHMVRILSDKAIPGPDGKPMKRPHPIPARYSASSDQKREVTPGDNEINFELTTK